MSQTKHLNLLGLAYRARKIITGTDLVIDGVRRGEVKLVIISNDASDNVYKKVTDKCNTYETDVIVGLDRYDIGSAMGKDMRVVVGITDDGFAKRIKQVMKEEVNQV